MTRVALRTDARRIFTCALVLAASVVGAAAAGPTSFEPQAFDLQGCVRRALAANPEYLDLVDGARSAELGQAIPLAEFDFKLVPSLSGGLQGSNDTDQRYALTLRRKFMSTGAAVEVSGGTSVFSQVPQTSIPHLTETRVLIEQPLWRGRTEVENRARVDEASRRVGAARYAIQRGREDIAARVVRGYYDVVRADRLVAVAEQSIERVERLAAISQAKLDIGAVSRMDVLRAQLRVGELRNQLLDQKTRRATATDQLKLMIGLDPEALFDLAMRIDPTVVAGLLAQDRRAIEARAITNRPEIQDARDELREARRKVALAEKRYWPEVSLVGTYARQGVGESLSESLELDRDEWSVGVRSTVPLERTAERVAIAEAEIVVRGRQRRLLLVESEVRRQVREAYRQFDRARASLALASEVVAQADQQVELARFRYEKGVTDNTEVVQAEAEHAEARIGYVLQAIEESLAGASIHRAVGDLAAVFDDPVVSPSGQVTD